MAGRLPVVRVTFKGTKASAEYFIDERLHELRRTNNPHEFLKAEALILAVAAGLCTVEAVKGGTA